MKGISFGSYRFAPRLAPTLAALLVCLLTISLGNWQTRRAEQKMTLQAQLDAYARSQPMELGQMPLEATTVAQRPVKTRGKFLGDRTLFIDNRVHHGTPGYHVVTPLRIDGGQMHVLVNRGWIAAGPSRSQLPHVSTPESEVVIEGLAVVPQGHPYELGPDATEGPLRQNLVPGRVAVEMKLMIQPIVVLQTSAAEDGLLRDWPKPDAGVNTHRAYALQWYVMAVVTAGLWIGLNLRRTNTHE